MPLGKRRQREWDEASAGIMAGLRKPLPSFNLELVKFPPLEPGWRNWQTQRTQNPPVLSTLGVQLPLPAPANSLKIKATRKISLRQLRASLRAFGATGSNLCPDCARDAAPPGSVSDTADFLRSCLSGAAHAAC